MWSKFEQWGYNGVNRVNMTENWGKWWTLGTKKIKMGYKYGFTLANGWKMV